MEDYRGRFQQLLRELFQFDSAELDFGIYRIMNYKRDVIEKWITKDMDASVAAEFDKGSLADQSAAAQQLRQVAEQIRETLGEKALDGDGKLAEAYRGTPLGEKYVDLQTAATGAKTRGALEALVFNHLYTFFNRYYDNGDFISKRRYSRKQKYAIPYNGEEVYLHWANSDQYYIKTAEHFRDYSFKTPNGITVHFKLQDADVEKDNVKGDKRLFIPLSKETVFGAKAMEIVIPFEYRPLTEQEAITFGKRNQQEAIIAEAVEELPKQVKHDKALAALLGEERKTVDGRSVSFLEHHLRRYTRANTSDFFIHKDLQGFLTRELDFYIKNEVLNLDEVEAGGEGRSEGWFQLMRFLKAIGGHIIAFLAQIEDFQKKLFEKKKFITETQYCITVGNIAEEFYADIAANDAQWAEWKELFHIDEEQQNLFNSGVKNRKDRRVAFLNAHPTLVLDTKHFDQDFTDTVLASFENLDGMTDGLLVRSENFQALNLLTEKYREKVKCIYIDPPYNTGASQILYKNDYKDSSWLSLMDNRLSLARRFMEPTSVLVVAIDDYGLSNLSKLLEGVYPNYEIQRVVVNHYPGSGTGRSNISRTHEYALFVVPVDEDVLRGEEIESGTRERPFRRSGTGENNYRIGRPNSFYAVLVDSTSFKIKGFEPSPSGDDYPKGRTKDGWMRIYPIGEDGSERVWSLSYESAEPALQDGLLKCTQNLVINRLIHDENRRSLLPSVWVDKQFNAVTYGTNVLTDLLGNSGLFSYPKSLYTVSTAVDAITHTKPNAIVMDFFAGSGTTGHATIHLNRQDDGERSFILAEMGEYFDTVLLPRIKKVTFSPEWKDGKPRRMATAEEAERSPRIVKYVRLESYEDALDNISFTLPKGQKTLEFDDYLLKYMLEWETKDSTTLLNVEKLANPFRYELSITQGAETTKKVVDIPETFNYLLGLHVTTRQVHHDKGPEGTDRRYLVYRVRINHRRVVVIWRDTEGWAKKDLERDKKFVAEKRLTDGADEVFVNGDSFIPNARALEPIFKSRMFAEVRG